MQDYPTPASEGFGFEKQAIFKVLAQIKQVSGVGGLASLAIKDYILQFWRLTFTYNVN